MVSPPAGGKSLLHRWGSQSIDLFVMSLRAKLPLYCSLVPDPQAVFEDAFHHPWDNLNVYTFPPFSSSRKGGGSSQKDTQSLHDSDRPPLAGEGVVRRPVTSTDPTTSGTSVVGPVVAAAPLQQVPPRRPRTEPSCLVTFQCLL